MSKTIAFFGPPPGVAIGQTNTLRFVLTGFTDPTSVTASGFFQSALRFDIVDGSLSFDPGTGQFSFQAFVDFAPESPCGPEPDGGPGGGLLLASGSHGEHPAIILTEQIKLEFVGLRCVPAPLIHHQGFRMSFGGPLKFTPPPETSLPSDGDFSITIIDSDGEPTTRDFPAAIHYTIPPGP